MFRHLAGKDLFGQIKFIADLGFRHIHQKAAADNKVFIFGMEHYKSKPGIEGEKALVEAYLTVDNFLD